MRLARIACVVFLCCMMLAGVCAAEMTGQQKLLAKRAALVDAYRNLAEKVKGLQVNSQTYVRDFVAQSDQINTDLDTFLKGARVVNAVYLPDGTCEVEVEIGVKELVVELNRVKKQVVHLDQWKTIYFDKITEYYKDSSVQAKGSGVPRGETGQAKTSIVTESIPGWENVTPQGRLMAERAALVDAYRNLAENIRGLKIDAETYVRDFVAESDQIQTQLDTWLKGVEPKGPYRYLPDGICEVTVEAPIREVVEELVKIRSTIHWWQNVRYETIDLQKIAEYTTVEMVRATGSGVPPEKYTNASSEAAPAWATAKTMATGTGVPPKGATGTEARLMAERAAKVDALRNLAEKVYGVRIDATTLVRDFVTQNDRVKADVDVFMRGADVVATRQLPDGSVQVDVGLDMKGVWEIFKKHNAAR